MKTLLGIVLVYALIAGLVLVGGVSLDYVIEFWGSRLAGKPVHVPLYASWLAAAVLVFTTRATVWTCCGMAVLTWVISFVLPP